DVLSLFISALRINFLRGSGFSSNGKTWHGRGGGRAAVAHDASERITNFFGGFSGNNLTQHYRSKRANCFAVRCSDRFHNARHDQLAAVGNGRHRCRHLQRCHSDLMPHRNTGDGNFAPRFWRPNEPVNLARQLNSCALAESEASNVFVKFLVAHSESKFSRSDIARFDEDLAHAQIRKRAMIVQSSTAEIPETVLTKNRRIGVHLTLIESGGGRHDLEC